MKLLTFFNITCLLMTIYPWAIFFLGPVLSLQFIFMLYQTYQIYYKKQTKNVIFITDFEENINDYLAIELLVKMQKLKLIKVLDIVVNGDNIKAQQLRLFLKDLGTNDVDFPITLNEVKDSYDISELDSYYIDQCNASEMIEQICSENKKVSIIGAGDLSSLVTASRNSELKSLSEIYVMDNIGIVGNRATRLSSNTDNNFMILFNNLQNKTFFKTVSTDISRHINISDKSLISLHYSKDLVLPYFQYINEPLLMLSMFNDDLFDSRNYGKYILYMYDNNKNKIINKIEEYLI